MPTTAGVSCFHLSSVFQTKSVAGDTQHQSQHCDMALML
jgi:hypothetical protein